MRGFRSLIASVAAIALIMPATAPEGNGVPPPPRTADPVRCNVDGRTPQELESLREYVATRGATAPDTPLYSLPDGSPADAETFAAVSDVVDEIFACLAAGGWNRAYLLLSDRYLVRDFADPDEAVSYVAGLDPAHMLEAGGRSTSDVGDSSQSGKAEASSDDGSRPLRGQAIYSGPWNVQVLSDGRVAATIWLAPAFAEDEHPAPGVTAVWFFINERGKWRMDGTLTTIWREPGSRHKSKRNATGDSNLIFVADLLPGPEAAGTPIP